MFNRTKPFNDTFPMTLWRSFTRLLFIFRRIDLLIFQISLMHGFIKQQRWADLKLSLWSFSVMKVGVFAIYLIMSPSLIPSAPAYITLKDHKDNFRSANPSGLVNPSKTEIGQTIKSILENINKNLVKLLSLESVIKWF